MNDPIVNAPEPTGDPVADPKPATLEVSGVVINFGIPIPEANGGRKAGSKWDPIIEAMQPGASVFFADGDDMARNVNSFQRVAKKRGVLLTIRKMENDPEFEKPGTRIWRRPE